MEIRIKSYVTGIFINSFSLSFLLITWKKPFYVILEFISNINPWFSISVILVLVYLSYIIAKNFVLQFYFENLTILQKVLYFVMNIIIASIICSLVLFNYYDYYFYFSLKYDNITPILACIIIALIPYIIGNIGNSFSFFKFENINYRKLHASIIFIKSTVEEISLEDEISPSKLDSYYNTLFKGLNILIGIAEALRSEEYLQNEKNKLDEVLKNSSILLDCLNLIHTNDRRDDFLNLFKLNISATATNDCCNSVKYFISIKINRQ